MNATLTQKSWRQVISRIEGVVAKDGFIRKNDEVFCRMLDDGSEVGFQLQPLSKVVTNDVVGVSLSYVVRYPGVDGMYERLWEISDRKGDIYWPFSKEVAAEGAWNVFEIGVENALSNEVDWLDLISARAVEDSIGELKVAVSLLLSHPESPWFSRATYENFLPVALIFMGEYQYAIDFVGRVLSAYKPMGESTRVKAYRRFSDRLIAYVGELRH